MGISTASQVSLTSKPYCAAPSVLVVAVCSGFSWPIFLILAALMVVGFIANMLVKPVADKYFMTDAGLAEVQKVGHEKSVQKEAISSASELQQHGMLVKLAWLAVLIPISYGVWSTVQKAWALFS